MTEKKKKRKKKGAAQQQQAESRQPQENQSGTKRQLTAVMLAAAALFIALSLASYSPDDPSLNHYAADGVKNLMGPVGAHLAAFLQDMLGLASWIVVFLPGYAALLTAGLVSIPAEPLPILFSGWALIILSMTILLSQLSRWVHIDIFYRAGGLSGRILSDFLTAWTGTAGTFLISGVMLLAGLLTATPSIVQMFIRMTCRIWSTPGRTGKNKGNKQKKSGSTISISDHDNSTDSEGSELVPRITAPPKNRKPEKRKTGKDDLDQSEQDTAADFAIRPVKGEFRLPLLSFLQDVPDQEITIDREIYLSNARTLEQKLLDFSVAGKVVEICPGPVVTMYEFAPAPGIKINKVASLSDDLALALKTHSVRIVAPIPGKAVIGIELANTHRQGVWLKEILASDVFRKNSGQLLLALGNDIVGQPVVTDLARMPHMLIAGATGTGKSVGLNAMICSLLYRLGPDRLRMLMVDPKRIELSLYDGIPHLIHPVVSEPKEATRALKWAVMEMERRYQLLEDAHARNLDSFNASTEDPLPYLVIIIDELADLMMVSSKDVEAAIARLAQMARAAGIHLLIATQRPSVDVLTGLIKANFPARLSFKVSSKVDSRTILDVMGAERLLGMGDMLFLPPGSSALERIHGAYVSEREIMKVVEFIKDQGEPEYDPTVTEPVPGDEDAAGRGSDDFSDDKYDEAVEIVTSTGLASISGLQRRMRIGYNRAARMIEQMEREGVVTPTDSMGRRQVIARKYEDD